MLIRAQLVGLLRGGGLERLKFVGQANRVDLDDEQVQIRPIEQHDFVILDRENGWILDSGRIKFFEYNYCFMVFKSRENIYSRLPLLPPT